ncbi:uncharacterized protein [Arachis hypogaea]|uniref:uncharacterized protein n=1 Tax=Arachis hypogaea TaxID=3818 RepID=UPI003B226C7C
MALPSEITASAIVNPRTTINTIAFKLDENNFVPWRRQALAFIKSNKLKEHLDPRKVPRRYGSEQDRLTNTETKEFDAWEQEDQFLVSWFFASMDPEFTHQLAKCEFAYEIWFKLKDYFAKRMKSKVKQLKTQIKTIKLQGSVIEYISKIKKVTNSLSALGAPLTSEEFVEAVAQGLNEDYSAFITMIISKADEITQSEVEALLVGQEELVERFKKNVLGTMHVNLAQGRGQEFRGRARGRGFRGGRSFYYGNSRPQCQLCGRIGHIVWDCYHRFNQNYQRPYEAASNSPAPPSSAFHQPQSQTDSQPRALVAAAPLTTPLTDRAWYLDTGASHHLIFDGNNLVTGSEYEGSEQVFTGNGQGMCINNIGRTILFPDQETNDLLLRGSLRGGLYQFDNIGILARAVSSSGLPSFEGRREALQFEVWHRRLGHPAAKTVAKVMQRCKIVDDDMNKRDTTAITPLCNACCQGKHHNFPFSDSLADYNTTLELVYSDIWRPAPIISSSDANLHRQILDLAQQSLSQSSSPSSTPLAQPESSVNISAAHNCPLTDDTAMTTFTSVFSSSNARLAKQLERRHVALPTTAPTRTHPMVIRSRAGIFKPKLFTALVLDNVVDLTQVEPSSVVQALTSPHWKAAMDEEYAALLKCKTWNLVEESPIVEPIGCRWVFRIKRQPDGTIQKYKASLVAKSTTVRTLLSIAVSKGWRVRQFDFNNAFLNGDLHEKVYMVQPEGYALGSGLSKYVKDLLNRVEMLEARPVTTPMASTLKLDTIGTTFDKPFLYRSIVGGLQYATITRPDIAFSVNKVSQFMHAPLEQHWKAVKRILRYLAGTIEFGLEIPRSSDFRILTFCDSDWTTDPVDRRSTTGYYIFLGVNLINWSSRKQTAVARSSAEAEFRALADAMTDTMWLQKLLHEMHIPAGLPPTLFCDNQSTMLMSQNPILHSRSKHFEIDLHFVRHRVEDKQAYVVHIPSQDQIADVLTKPVSHDAFLKIRCKLRLVDQAKLKLRGNVEDK